MAGLAVIAGLVGCAATLDLSLPPSPAVALHADRVAVIARDRACLDTADALVGALRTAGSGITVDPRAEVTLELFGCGDAQTWTIDERGSASRAAETRRGVDARAFALVEVAADGHTVADLLGSGRHVAPPGDPFAVGARAARRAAIGDLSRDLVLQLSPVPTLVQRRVYPNAPDGSAHDLLTRAARAEASGDVEGALALAERAMSLHPEPATASYLRDLRRAAAVR